MQKHLPSSASALFVVGVVALALLMTVCGYIKFNKTRKRLNIPSFPSPIQMPRYTISQEVTSTLPSYEQAIEDATDSTRKQSLTEENQLNSLSEEPPPLYENEDYGRHFDARTVVYSLPHDESPLYNDGGRICDEHPPPYTNYI